MLPNTPIHKIGIAIRPRIKLIFIMRETIKEIVPNNIGVITVVKKVNSPVSNSADKIIVIIIR